MHVLLPPSEAKRPGGRGRPLAARARTHPLASARGRVIAALTELLETEEAAAALLLPPSAVAEALSDNASALSSPTMPAIERYCGVVYEGLDVASLTPRARRLANQSVLVFSGLFGVLRGGDPTPRYRVPGKATLPGIGVATAYWRRELDAIVPKMLGRGLIVDLRSSDYAAMWNPAPGSAAAGRLVKVRVLSVKPDGSRGVVSYPSKLAKGRLTAALLEQGAAGAVARTAEDIAEAWTSLGGHHAECRPGKLGVALDLFD